MLSEIGEGIWINSRSKSRGNLMNLMDGFWGVDGGG